MAIVSALILVVPLAAGPMPGQAQVRIADLQATRTKTELQVSFRVLNGSDRDVYVACEEPACLDPANPRYIEVKDRTLVIAHRLFLPPPGWNYAAPPYLGFRRLPAHGQLESRFSLAVPVRTCSHDPRVRFAADVGLEVIRSVQLELAMIPCADRANMRREHDGVFLLYLGSVIQCSGREQVVMRLRRFLTAEAPLRNGS